eukprot:3127856-Karenia_brevis.AAC.1
MAFGGRRMRKRSWTLVKVLPPQLISHVCCNSAFPDQAAVQELVNFFDLQIVASHKQNNNEQQHWIYTMASHNCNTYIGRTSSHRMAYKKVAGICM